jgi:hypothetical protein
VATAPAKARTAASVSGPAGSPRSSQMGAPSARPTSSSAQRGRLSPGYHLPGRDSTAAPGRSLARSSAASFRPAIHLVGPSASPFHSGASACSRELSVGSPPLVSVSPAAVRAASARSAPASSASQAASGKGAVGRTSWPSRPTFMENDTSTAGWSEVPSSGAPSAGRATEASGMCPSPAKRPLVGSRPIQPPPGR